MQSLLYMQCIVYCSISHIVFIVFTSKFVVEIQNLIYLSRFVKYNLEPYAIWFEYYDGRGGPLLTSEFRLLTSSAFPAKHGKSKPIACFDSALILLITSKYIIIFLSEISEFVILFHFFNFMLPCFQQYFHFC